MSVMKKLMAMDGFRKLFGLDVESNHKKPGERNPHRGIWLSPAMKKAVESIRRVDEDGIFYSMDCTDYYSKGIILKLLSVFGFYRSGCSAFQAVDPQGKFVTYRNYDYPHKDENGDFMDLTMLVRCAPEGGYRSIAFADVLWLNTLGGSLSAGSLDDRMTDTSMCALLPYICMDGMNEKGLTASILVQDLKAGETPVKQEKSGRPSAIHTILMRKMLDTCADTKQAVELARSWNLLNVRGGDFHIFVSDASGESCVLEWRYNELHVTRTDCVTNFMVGFDDGEDFYRDGEFTEAFEKLEDTKREYHWGYGHGYRRFNDIVQCLEAHMEGDGRPVLPEEDGVKLLEKVFQPHTLHTAVYRQNDLTASVWLLKDTEKRYDFTL